MRGLTTLLYDVASRRTTLQDSSGITRLYQYDADNRPTTQIDTLSATGAPIVTMVDSYDAVGNRIARVKDGVATTWIYDPGYRLTGQQQSGAAATFVYDPVGNILLKEQQDGNAPMTITVDADNRITTILQDSTLTTVTSDNNGNPIVENANGLLTSLSYDDENRITGIQFPPPGGRSTYTYSYDDENRLTGAAFPPGGLSTHTYSADRLLRTALETGGEAVGEIGVEAEARAHLPGSSPSL